MGTQPTPLPRDAVIPRAPARELPAAVAACARTCESGPATNPFDAVGFGARSGVA